MYADVNHDGAAGSVTIEPGVALAAIRAIDKFTDWTGKCVLVILVPLVLSNVVEVVMRYLLKQPTIWASDATIMIASLIAKFAPMQTLGPKPNGM